MGHKTEGRAKCEIVNRMLNSTYLTSTNAKNHITISISTHSYRAAFNKRTLLNALSKLTDTAAWLCNQGCGSGYFSKASASASTNKKRKNDR